jgi:hypothetical protein
MSTFQTKVSSYQGFEHHPSVNISELDKTGNEQLNRVKERILAHSKT